MDALANKKHEHKSLSKHLNWLFWFHRSRCRERKKVKKKCRSTSVSAPRKNKWLSSHRPPVRPEIRKVSQALWVDVFSRPVDMGGGRRRLIQRWWPSFGRTTTSQVSLSLSRGIFAAKSYFRSTLATMSFISVMAKRWPETKISGHMAALWIKHGLVYSRLKIILGRHHLVSQCVLRDFKMAVFQVLYEPTVQNSFPTHRYAFRLFAYQGRKYWSS